MRRYSMSNKRSFWESFIMVMILIAIAQIFLEDISRLGNWKIPLRKSLIIIGFLLDFIFTVEFIIRSILSRKVHGWIHYFKAEKGWVDLFSSVPLMLFNSGPIMIGMFFPGVLIALPFLGVLNILKITKILRIARVLRLLRVLKIFKVTQEEAEKSGKQLTRAISISIVAITLVLIVSPIFSKLYYNMDNSVKLKNQKYVALLQDWYNSYRRGNINRINYLSTTFQEDKDVLYLYQTGRTAVNHLGSSEPPSKVIPNTYFYTDYKVLKYLQFKLYYSIREIVKENARINLLIETIIIVMILGMLIFYSDPSIAGKKK